MLWCTRQDKILIPEGISGKTCTADNGFFQKIPCRRRGWKKFLTSGRAGSYIVYSHGRLAQLVRAPARHAGGRWFNSNIAHIADCSQVVSSPGTRIRKSSASTGSVRQCAPQQPVQAVMQGGHICGSSTGPARIRCISRRNTMFLSRDVRIHLLHTCRYRLFVYRIVCYSDAP